MLVVNKSEHRPNFRILLACAEPPFSRLRRPSRIGVLREVVGGLLLPRANDLGWGIRHTTTLTDRKIADSVPQRLREAFRVTRRFLNSIVKNLIKNRFGIWRLRKAKLDDNRINERLCCTAQVRPIENIFRLSRIITFGRFQLEIFRIMC